MLSWINKKRNKKGFTLIELIVVIAILGILAAIAIPRLSGARNNAAESADAASIRTIQSAIGLAEASGDLDLSKSGVDAADIKSAIIPKYLAEMPVAQTKDATGWVVTVTGGTETEGIFKPYEIDIKAGEATSGWESVQTTTP